MDKRKEAKEAEKINLTLSATVGIINSETTDDEKISAVMNMLMPYDNNIFLKEINGKTLLEYISTIHNTIHNRSKPDKNQRSCKLSSDINKLITAARFVGIDLTELFENISKVLDYLSKNMRTIKERYKEFITQISEKLNIISKNEKYDKYKNCVYDKYQTFKDKIQSVNLDNNNANYVQANDVQANDDEEKNVKYFTTILMKISKKNAFYSAYKQSINIITNTHTCSSVYCKEYSDCQEIPLKLAAIYNVYIPNIKDVSLQSVQLKDFQKKFYSSHDDSTCAEYKNLLASTSKKLTTEIEKLKDEINRIEISKEIEKLKEDEINRIEISTEGGYKYRGKKYTKKRKLRKMKKSRSKKN